MIKLALIGDPEVQHYVVADRLWELISVLIDKKFKFTLIPLATPDDVIAAFQAFQKDSSFVGFNIAAPWKDVLADRVNKLEEIIGLPIINTVYKDKSGSIIGANTDPLAAQSALEAETNLYKCESVLVIGANGAGQSIAHHLCHNLRKTTYLYDPSVECKSNQESKGVNCLLSLSDVTDRKYDLIINATPLGRYYFDQHIKAFTSPLDLETLDKVSHKNTIVQETNYLPSSTLLLQMARHLDLRVIGGDLMLVFGAVESLRRYFGITLDENTVRMLVEEIGEYIAEREVAILEQGNI
jgi:shikimate 5-dehydrogenase